MLRRKYLLLLGMVLVGLSGTACSDKDDDDMIIQQKYPLMDFSVRIGDTYYHGKIDQTTHRVEIGTIEDANTITGVDYTLINDSAKLTPDPATFIGAWKQEQQLTVTTQEKSTTTYTIVLTKFTEQTSNIIFEDNFDVDGEPDPTKWSLCAKAGSDWNDEMSESYDQAYVKDGNLVLVGEKVDGVYKAGGIETQGKFAFTFGKVEVRARITSYPNGAFPAIWMMPEKFIYQGWPNCGEIDIMEHIKQEPHIWSSIHNNYYDNLHIDNPPHTGTKACNIAEYNIYGIEWTEDKIDFFVNGEKTFTYPNLKLEDEAEKMQWPFSKDSSFYLILNMGLGGDRPGSWPGPIDDNNLPAVMEIDWVKVSKLD